MWMPMMMKRKGHMKTLGKMVSVLDEPALYQNPIEFACIVEGSRMYCICHHWNMQKYRCTDVVFLCLKKACYEIIRL